MGNCINRVSYQPPSDQLSDFDSPGSAAYMSPRWGAVEPDFQERAESPKFSGFAQLPQGAQSRVTRFLDIPALKNLRLSGKAGAELSKSWWVGNADELETVLDKFNPQRIDGITLDGREFTNAHMHMLPPTLKRFKILNHSTGAQITEEGFAALRGMRLRYVDLRGFSTLTDACMANLRGMPLEELYIHMTATLTDAGMEHLQGMPLRILHLPLSTQITDIGLANVLLDNLDRLNLQGCHGITDASFTRIAKSKLRQLELDFGPSITDEGIKSLRNSSIEFLGIAGCNDLTPACFDDICAMPALKRIGMSHYDHISNEQIEELEARLLMKDPAFQFGSNL